MYHLIQYVKRLYRLGTFLLMSVLLFNCAGPPTATDVSLIPNPNEKAPLAGILSFKSDRPVVPTLSVSDGTNEWTVTPDDEPRTEHQTLVLGLRPGRTHQVVLRITDTDDRQTVVDTLSIETPPLPDDFPPIRLTTEPSENMERGVTMVNVFRWVEKFEDDPDWGLAVAVDENGEVVWYYQTDHGISEPRRMFNGNILVSGHIDGRLYEVDMLGNIINQWHSSGAIVGEVPENSKPVDTDTFHHDVLELASGNFLGLGLELLTMENFPAEYPPGTKRETAEVASDELVEFDRDGNTVRKWSVAEILDPERLGDGSLSRGFYEKLYNKEHNPIDITHSNALYYVEEEDALIVSSYSQCAIYKVNMATGDLIWILGDPTGWNAPWSDKLLAAKGDVTWPCHQHGLEMTPRGTLLMYDNGAGRFVPPNKPLPPAERYSRAVEFRIDEVAGTVEEVWSYGPEYEQFCSPFISDADYLPETGNVLVADGGRFRGPDGEQWTTFGGHQWGRVFEVTYGENSEKVWEIVIEDPEVRYSIYRAQRYQSLYPKLDKPTG